jgi:outer membrane immunogenic protein
MTKTSVAVLALIGLAGPALAADISVPRPYYTPTVIPVLFNWTGFYVGGNVGGHSGRDRITSTTDPTGWTTASAAEIDTASPVNLQMQGVTAGAQLGFNLQMGSHLVGGIEADANWASGSKSRTLVFPGSVNVAAGDFMTNSSNAVVLATVRGRLGLTMDRAMLYGTGGLALATLKTTDSFAAFNGTSLATNSTTTNHAGWTAGGGLEFAFSDYVSAKVEYLYVAIPTFDILIPSCPACLAGSDILVHHRFSDNIVRGGLNLRFGTAH